MNTFKPRTFSINSFIRARAELKASTDYRSGFLAAVDRRLFPELPPAHTDAEMQTRIRESRHYAKGLEDGTHCPLACTPGGIDENTEYGDQYSTAAWISFALVCAALVTLWALSQP